MDEELDEGIFTGLDPITFETDRVGLRLIATAAGEARKRINDSVSRNLLRELGLYNAYIRYINRHPDDDLPMPEPWVRFFKLLATSPYKKLLIKMYRMKFGLE